MKTVTESQVDAAFEAAAATRPIVAAGGNNGARGFKAAAVPSQQPTTPAEEIAVNATPEQAAAILNAEASLAEHGATPEQAAAMAEIKRIVTESSDPDGAARETAEHLPRTEQAICHRLDGQCIEHYTDIDGTVIHHGVTVEVADNDGVTVPLRLAQWDNETPYLEIWDREFAVPALRGLITALQQDCAHLIHAQQPEPQPPRLWTITTTDGQTATGTLMTRAEDDPSQDGVDPELLQDVLGDIGHRRHYAGPKVNADLAGIRGREVGETSILLPQIEVDPFDTDLAKRVPTVAVEMTAGSDDWISGLDPAGVAGLAAKLRAQADLLDQVAADLAAARADWAANGGQQ
jgi:transcription elongation GreA/GreB family factor